MSAGSPLVSPLWQLSEACPRGLLRLLSMCGGLLLTVRVFAADGASVVTDVVSAVAPVPVARLQLGAEAKGGAGL